MLGPLLERRPQLIEVRPIRLRRAQLRIERRELRFPFAHLWRDGLDRHPRGGQVHQVADLLLQTLTLQERLALLAEPALDVLYRATRNAPPCEVCGRSDADRDPNAIRAAIAILDRFGLGPSAKLEVSSAPEQDDDRSIEEIVARCEVLLLSARAIRDAKADQQRPGVIEGDVADGVLLPEGEDVPIHGGEVSIPEGILTPRSG